MIDIALDEADRRRRIARRTRTGDGDRHGHDEGGQCQRPNPRVAGRTGDQAGGQQGDARQSQRADRGGTAGDFADR
ncbi:hypothetical protein A0U87_17130 [Sphingobium sp. MP9-4]|nr:hypothetical protein A0U87_17130 [Sphingobium sp. MP9-4]